MAEKEKKQPEKEKKEATKKVIKKSRTVDNWKKKQWFNIIAPNEFDRKVLGETVAEKPKNLVGRILKVDLGQLTGQRQKRHISVLFRVDRVEGNNAECITVGHDTSQGFLNRLVRRRMSKIEQVQEIETSDARKVKVKSFALSVRKLSKSQEADMRKALVELIAKSTEKKGFAQVSQEIIFGATASKIFKQLSKIAPLRRVEIVKSKLLEGK